MKLAHPSAHGGARILRRGYNFTDGNDALGRLDAGLFFIAFERDPRTGFIPLQQALARHDGLNEYIVHTGSGLYASRPVSRRSARTGRSSTKRSSARRCLPSASRPGPTVPDHRRVHVLVQPLPVEQLAVDPRRPCGDL